jgi:hypothetical protein
VSLFTARFRLADESRHIDYESIDDCLSDESLAVLLDTYGAEVVLWAGPLRLTGTPIRSSRELRRALVDSANAIMRRVL